MPRAGSSTLQEALYYNRVRLAEHGLLYPVFDADVAGSDVTAQLYNHKSLLRTARSRWFTGRFHRCHDHIARQIRAAAQPHVLLSYEGWWGAKPAGLLNRSLARITADSSDFDISVAAIIRDPVSFILSLYRLDVLHGRTLELFDDYWPARLSEPRLRYSSIASTLIKEFRTPPVFLDFNRLCADGRLVGNVLAGVGAEGVLQAAGLAPLARYRSKGSDVFSDPFVSVFLFVARRLGLRQMGARRKEIMTAVAGAIGRDDLADEFARLSIPLTRAARSAIETACAPEAEPFFRRYLDRDFRQPGGDDKSRQSIIAEASRLGRALIERVAAG